MSDDSARGGNAQRIGDALATFLRRTGLGERVKQADVLARWPELVGPEVAAVTRAISISDDGTLFAVARTAGWLNELTFMERELLENINRVSGSKPLRRIRWALMR
jgi:predicted nucleic acid-binding Zn ribbon protein